MIKLAQASKANISATNNDRKLFRTYRSIIWKRKWEAVISRNALITANTHYAIHQIYHCFLSVLIWTFEVYRNKKIYFNWAMHPKWNRQFWKIISNCAIQYSKLFQNLWKIILYDHILNFHSRNPAETESFNYPTYLDIVSRTCICIAVIMIIKSITCWFQVILICYQVSWGMKNVVSFSVCFIP